MKFVTKEHLESWANTTFSKASLPYLISKLVRATTPISTKLSIPSGSATYLGGWDGVVNCEIETAYVPKGLSLWEFGTGADFKTKADGDYEKRKETPGRFLPAESVFIFVTPRLWTKKQVWINEKKSENYWKDVIVYDSIEIEQWLDLTSAVARWFASQDGVGAYPFDGVMTADDFWEEWSVGVKGLALLPDVVISGREFERNLLLAALQGEPTIKGIKASTKNEAIAFIIACAKSFHVDDNERFFSKSLVVDTEANFRGIRINTGCSLNLIPRFDESQPLYGAVSRGHHVLVPLGADDSFNQETITLPIIDRDGQIKSLIESGISEEMAEKLSKESGRNVTILKKLLGFPYTKADWFKVDAIREIVPALLLGRWDETYVGDIQLIERISGKKYAEYLITLNKWKNFEEAPIIQIGETWRLTAPMDLWTNLSSYLTPNDFQNLLECFISAFNEGNPVIETNEKDKIALLYNKKNTFSNWSREGLTQSLILVSRLGGIKFPNLEHPQRWVDSIINRLLYNATAELWISVNYELPLIAEASPDSFIEALQNSLSKAQPEVMDMFLEKDGVWEKASNHTGLLWALENLAWLPEYLRDVSVILLKLAQLDPGGRLSNRPINSIAEIYKPWHYQTLASFEERMAILKYAVEKERGAGWTLLLRMLPESHGIAHPTHKMRWRMFDQNTRLNYTYEEAYATYAFVIEVLLGIFDYSEQKFSQLLQEIPNLIPSDREKIINWADRVSKDLKIEKNLAWESLRKILHQHRSHSDTTWALPESVLERLEEIYNKLSPVNVVEKYIWLFNDHWPAFPDGAEYQSSHEQQAVRNQNARNNAVKYFLEETGLDATIELRKIVKQPWLFGGTLANVVVEKNNILTVLNCLYDSKELIGFVQNFIFQKSIDEGFDWTISLFKELQERDFSNEALADFLVPLTQGKQLWEFTTTLSEEIQEDYWKKVNPNFYNLSSDEKEMGIKRLLNVKRFFTAVDVASHFIDSFSTKLLINMLYRTATEPANEISRSLSFEIGHVFEELDKRTDLDNTVLLKLEWLYLPILSSRGIKRNPKGLEEALAKDPGFFIEVLKWVYIPEDKSLLDIEREGMTDEEIGQRAGQAFHLLHSWKRIPGMGEDDSLDEKVINEWVADVRSRALKVSRLNVADAEIGKVLAQYPEEGSLWPQEIIFRLIEEINSDSMKRNYSAAMFNKRSFSSRGAFEGGDIEREKAFYFGKLAKDFRNKYPNVAQIFAKMEKGYLEDAKKMDESAERDKLEY